MLRASHHLSSSRREWLIRFQLLVICHRRGRIVEGRVFQSSQRSHCPASCSGFHQSSCMSITPWERMLTWSAPTGGISKEQANPRPMDAHVVGPVSTSPDRQRIQAHLLQAENCTSHTPSVLDSLDGHGSFCMLTQPRDAHWTSG